MDELKGLLAQDYPWHSIMYEIPRTLLQSTIWNFQGARATVATVDLEAFKMICASSAELDEERIVSSYLTS